MTDRRRRLLAASILVASLAPAAGCRVPRPGQGGPPGGGVAVAPPTVWTMPARAECASSYVPDEDAAPMQDEALVEASGIVASPVRSDVYWSHNDSGDEARLFAVGEGGEARGRLTLPFEARDIEDISAGPCPDLQGPCLYVADVGNNRFDRDDQAVYAVPEPAFDDESGAVIEAEIPAERFWRYPIAAPDEPANIEGFFVLPDATAMIFIEKKDGEARVLSYPAPFTPDEPVTLSEIARVLLPGDGFPGARLVTGADVHPSGRRLLLRTYTSLYEYVLGEGEGVAAVQTLAPESLPFSSTFSELQGEAVAYDGEGTGIVTVSEDVERAPGQPLHRWRCGAP